MSVHREFLAFLASAFLFASSSALAQEADHLDREDATDFREHLEDGRPQPYEYGLDGMPKPSWTFTIDAPVLFDSNPFWAPDGSTEALLVTPSAALIYSHPALIPGWDLELEAGAAADFFSSDPDELNEARLHTTATVFHEVGNAGTLSLGFRSSWIYVGENFGNFDNAQQRYTVTFAPNISDKVWTSLSGEYRDSSRPGNRRFIANASFDVTLLDSQDGRIGFFQDFAFSRFTAGANDGRKDLLSLSELMFSPNLDLPGGVRVEIMAVLFHRFSNREASRFTAIQIGPALGFRF